MILIVVGSFYLDICDLIVARHTVEEHRRIIYSVDRLTLGVGLRRHYHECQCCESYKIAV